MTRPLPDYTLEQAAHARGFGAIAGVDEVGRGPLAGPVTAAALVLDPDAIPEGIRDSKQLGAKARARLFDELTACARVSVAHASVAEIDEINILQASLLAMRRAVEGLDPAPDYLLIDGNRLPRGLPQPASAVVRGDARALSIAAASIVAKVSRDRIMEELAAAHPGYGWETNRGYPSKGHLAALAALGVTPHHRRSFRPVHNILYQE